MHMHKRRMEDMFDLKSNVGEDRGEDRESDNCEKERRDWEGGRTCWVGELASGMLSSLPGCEITEQAKVSYRTRVPR